MRRTSSRYFRRAPCRLHEIFMQAGTQRTVTVDVYRVSKSAVAIVTISAYRRHSFSHRFCQNNLFYINYRYDW